MVIFRWVFGLLLFASVFCYALGFFKRDPRWQRFGILLLKWTVFAALGFFAVLFVQRLLGG